MPRDDELVLTLESSDFSCDGLEVRKLSAKEAIGRLFDFQIEVVLPGDGGPSPESMAGAHVTLVMERYPGPGAGWHGVRRVEGMLAEVEDMLATHADMRAYRLRLVPAAFALAMVETQDIFMGHSVPEIIQGKLDAVNLGASVDMRLHGSYAPREFVVQYKESDLAFVSRLAEHLGISFYFLHGDDGEKIVFTDDASGFSPVEGAESIPFRARGDRCDVFALTAVHRVVPSYYAVRDYNYRAPQVDVTGEHELSAFPGGVIEFGAHAKTPEEAKAIAKVRAEERSSSQLVYAGKSGVPALAAGMRVTLTDHPDLGSVEVLVTEVEHEATLVVGAKGASDAPGYVNTFRAIPADRTYRPPRTTPKPRIAGLVTGIVDPGPAGQSAKYAQLDDQGRYLVRFLFDTTPPDERPASRPVRMIQNHAGENYGTHFPLKPGVEVVIAFIDGDPDRPLIVGAVPNPIKPSPVTNANPGIHRVKTSTGITVDMAE
jgi:type VI secretion system secreted protein VgrG